MQQWHAQNRVARAQRRPGRPASAAPGAPLRTPLAELFHLANSVGVAPPRPNSGGVHTASSHAASCGGVSAQNSVARRCRPAPTAHAPLHRAPRHAAQLSTTTTRARRRAWAARRALVARLRLQKRYLCSKTQHTDAPTRKTGARTRQGTGTDVFSAARAGMRGRAQRHARAAK